MSIRALLSDFNIWVVYSYTFYIFTYLYIQYLNIVMFDKAHPYFIQKSLYKNNKCNYLKDLLLSSFSSLDYERPFKCIQMPLSLYSMHDGLNYLQNDHLLYSAFHDALWDTLNVPFNLGGTTKCCTPYIVHYKGIAHSGQPGGAGSGWRGAGVLCSSGWNKPFQLKGWCRPVKQLFPDGAS